MGPAGTYGGLQVHLTELESFLRSEGCEVFVIKVLEDAHLANCGSNANEFKVRPGYGSFGWIKLKDWFIAALKARKFKADLYIAGACGKGYSMAGRFIPKESSSLFQIVTDAIRPADRTLKAMINYYKNVAVQSGALIKPFKEKMNFRGPIAVLPCFHQISSTKVRARQPAEGKEVKLAYFGRLAANKGLELLLNVLSLRKESIKWQFDIYGRGPEEEKLSNLIKSNDYLCRHVRLLGSYPAGSEYCRLLSNYHGLVAPSQATEGLPLVLLEAASIGLPFLSCRIGAIGDCEEDNPDCLIIDTGYKSLQEGVSNFLQNLIDKRYNNFRLKLWFENRHSKSCHTEIWRAMLQSPERFFSYG